jgi:hypothetical protein
MLPLIAALCPVVGIPFGMLWGRAVGWCNLKAAARWATVLVVCCTLGALLDARVHYWIAMDVDVVGAVFYLTPPRFDRGVWVITAVRRRQPLQARVWGGLYCSWRQKIRRELRGTPPPC